MLLRDETAPAETRPTDLAKANEREKDAAPAIADRLPAESAFATAPDDAAALTNPAPILALTDPDDPMSDACVYSVGGGASTAARISTLADLQPEEVPPTDTAFEVNDVAPSSLKAAHSSVVSETVAVRVISDGRFVIATFADL